MGVVYGDKMGDSDRAIEDFNKAIELNPNDADAYNNRGSPPTTTKVILTAPSIDYTKAIELNPDYIVNAY